MPEKDLALQVKRLRPSALRLLKQRLAAAPAEDKARFAGIPELSDVTSAQTPISQITQTGQNTPKTTSAGSDIPLWKKALNVFNAPFEWVDKNIQDPFAAAVTAPFTPSTGTSVPGESWLAREKREYENWQGPDIMPGSKTFRPVKGAVEFLPWLAPTLLSGGAGALAKGLQGAGAISKLGTASKVLQGASKLGKATESIGGFAKEAKAFGTAGKVAGTIAKVSPWGLAEAGTNKAVSLAGKGVKAVLGKGTPKVAGEVSQAAKAFAPDQPVAESFGPTREARMTGAKKVVGAAGSDTIPETTINLAHYSAKPNLKTINPELMSTGQSGSEKKFFNTYSDHFKTGEFAKRSYYYTEGQAVEPRFIGQKAYTTTQNLRIFDVDKATQNEIDKFIAKKETMLTKFKKEFGQNFGNLPEQDVEVNYAVAKALGYDALKNPDSVAVFKQISLAPKQVSTKAPEILVSRIAKEQNIPVAFIKLHEQPARVNGLKAVSKVEGLAYLKEVTTYSQDDVLKQRMIRSFSEGDLNDAGMIAEGILQTYHMDKAGAGYKQLADLLPETPVKPLVEPPKPPTAPPSELHQNIQTNKKIYAASYKEVFGATPKSSLESVYKTHPWLEKTPDSVDAMYWADELAAYKLEGKTNQEIKRELTERWGNLITPSKSEAITKFANEVVPPAASSGPDEFSSFWEAVAGKKGQKAWEDTQALRTAERTKRAASIRTRIESIPPEQLTSETYEQIWKELGSGELPLKTTKLGLPQELVDKGIQRINQVLSDRPYEAKGTVAAFLKAMDGKAVPRSDKPYSAYNLLKRVFGQNTADSLSNQTALNKILEGKNPTGVPSGFPMFPEESLLRQPVRPLVPETPPSLTSPGGTTGNVLDVYPSPTGVPSGFPTVPEESLLRQPKQPLILETPPTLKGTTGTGTVKPLPLTPNTVGIDEKVMNQLAALGDDNAKQLSLLPLSKQAQIDSIMKKLGLNLIDIANIPRVTQTILDESGVFRQNIIAFTRHPLTGIRSIGDMLKATFKPEYMDDIERMITTDPAMQKYMATKEALKDSLWSVNPNKTNIPLWKKEEAYASNLLGKVPVLGSVVRGSNRGMASFTNLMRYHMLQDADKQWVKKFASVGYKVTQEDLEGIVRLTKLATGRGDLKLAGFDFNKYGPILSAVFYSPRYLFSRFQWMAMMASPIKEVRVEAWKQLASFVGAGASVLGAMKLAGAGDIELDPRSTDFGKFKVGDTRLDIWGGYAQYVRLVTQLATNQRKSESGVIQPVTRGEVLGRFGTSKLSPVAGLVKDIFSGQTYLGEEFPVTDAKGIAKQIYERLTPLAIQDMIDGFNQSGVLGVVATSPGIMGVGVTTYSDTVQKEQDRVAKTTYGMSWDEVGLKYGKATQLDLEQSTPAIIAAEKEQEKRFASSNPSTMDSWYAEGKRIEDDYRKAVVQASNELKITTNGSLFKEKITTAQNVRRESYSSLYSNPKYQSIATYYAQPLTEKQKATMNIGDILRREYSQQMFSADMYDQFGNYDFDKAEQKEQALTAKYGSATMEYLDKYRGAQWKDKPAELVAFDNAKKLLKPFWKITDDVWAKYPPELKDMADLVSRLEATDPLEAKRLISKNPSILLARKYIAYYKKLYLYQHPDAAQVYKLYYS